MAMTQKDESHSWLQKEEEILLFAMGFSGRTISLNSSESEVQTQIPGKSGFRKIVTTGE